MEVNEAARRLTALPSVFYTSWLGDSPGRFALTPEPCCSRVQSVLAFCTTTGNE